MIEKDRIVAVTASVERQDLVRQLVKSWKAVTPEPRPELTVVAMGDDDGTQGWCKNQKLRVLRSAETLPFAKANNLGVKAALEAVPTAEWILLLNNDLILQPGFWPAFNEMTNLGYEIIGAKMLYPEGHQHASQIQHYGKVFSYDCRPFHILRYMPVTHPLAQQPRPFPCVTFACVAIKRTVWEGLGGLCEDYINGFEDDDFCLAAREAGAQIGVHQEVMAIHMESQSTGKDNLNKTQQWLKFKQKWVDSGRIIWPLGLWQGWVDA